MVEIDESKFGHRKYNSGRIVDDLWVFGEIHRRTRNKFIVPVINRSKEILISLIQQFILPSSIIISDGWRGYKHIPKLKNYNYVQGVLLH